MTKNKPEGTGTSNGPVQFRSVREMDKYIETRAEPLWSENPCRCGQAKRWKHKYCDACAARIKQVKHKVHERHRRKAARALSSS